MADHYFSKNQESPFRPQKMIMRFKGTEFELYTAGGVFSPKKLDNGSRLLIEKCQIKDDDSVLDLGCGYGVTGIAMKRKYPGIKLTLSDINQRAIKLVRMNLLLYKLKDVDVIHSDQFSSKKFQDKKFDVILLNPPQSAGKNVCFELIEGTNEHLVKGGNLQLVARHQKGGKPLSAKMEEIFGNLDVIGKGSGFRIYISTKE